jgi:hypothetical protein
MQQRQSVSLNGWRFNMGEIIWKTQEEIDLELQNPKLSDIEELAKQQTDLVFTLMTNGVI